MIARLAICLGMIVGGAFLVWKISDWMPRLAWAVPPKLSTAVGCGAMLLILASATICTMGFVSLLTILINAYGSPIIQTISNFFGWLLEVG